MHLQAYSFPVQSTFTEDAEQCLPKVLAEKNTLVMKVRDFSLYFSEKKNLGSEFFLIVIFRLMEISEIFKLWKFLYGIYIIKL